MKQRPHFTRLRSAVTPNGSHVALHQEVSADGEPYYVVATPTGETEFDRYDEACRAFDAEAKGA